MLKSRQLQLNAAAAIVTLLAVSACTPRDPNWRNRNAAPAVDAGATQALIPPSVTQQVPAAEVSASVPSHMESWQDFCASGTCPILFVQIGEVHYGVQAVLTPAETTEPSEGTLVVTEAQIGLKLAEASTFADVGLVSLPREEVVVQAGAQSVEFKGVGDADIPHDSIVENLVTDIANGLARTMTTSANPVPVSGFQVLETQSSFYFDISAE